MTTGGTSCDVQITATGTMINGTPIHGAEPIAWFHALLGEPTRIIPAGPPAPVDHRDNHIHYYDRFGITLNEHHYTWCGEYSALTSVLHTTHGIRISGLELNA
ncbi:MAG: DUF7738 domain-containing protein [Thermoguttaceae bacterium]